MNMTQAKHAFVTTTCNTCHEAGRSFYMGAASPALQGRPADHTSGTMLTSDCSACHTTADWNSGALPAGHMPNPGNQGCNVCHTGAPTNYATMASNAVLHTGITANCIQCHGTTQLSFYNNNDPPKPMVAKHIPSNTTPCESCHAGTPFTTFSGTTMTAAKHTLLLSDTGGTCDQCHDLSTLSFFGVTNLTTRPNGHHVGKDCNGCHSPKNWGGGAGQKPPAPAAPAHSTIATVINATARAQSTAPIVGTAAASNPLGAAGSPLLSINGNSRISHAGVTGACASCHDGVLAPGKSSTHIASNTACGDCHTTFAWIPARFEHRAPLGSCISCHLGVTASCVGCHNGSTALGKPVQHPITARDCSSCHNTLSWTATTPAPRLRPLLQRQQGASTGQTK
jgi:hypothetical protein